MIWKLICRVNLASLLFLAWLYRYQQVVAGPSHRLQDILAGLEEEILRIEFDLRYM